MKNRFKISPIFEKFADPFLILVIFALFLIPAITVLNLTPIHFPQKEKDLVLGVTETGLVTFIENLEKKDGIYISKTKQTTDNSYSLEINHLSHSIGTYKNLIFTAENPTDEQRVLKINTQHEITNDTEVSLKVENKNYLILKDGSIFPASIYLEPNEKIDVYLIIESYNDVSFSSSITLTVFID